MSLQITFEKKHVEITSAMEEVNNYFVTMLEQKIISDNDNLLKHLTIDDLAIIEEGQRELLTETESKEAKANRSQWITIFDGLTSNDEKIAFALLTVYRNSKVAALHLTNITQISKDIILPYIDKYPTEMLLNHILLISKLLNHYDKLFALGLISFMNRDSAAEKFSTGQYLNIFRVSFSRLGELVNSEYTYPDISHYLLSRPFYIIDEIKKINYQFKTLSCDDVVLKLFEPQLILRIIKMSKKIYSPYNVVVDNEYIEELMQSYGNLTQINDHYYL